MMMRKISRLGLAVTREAVSDGIIIGVLVFQTCHLLKQDLHVAFAKAKRKTGGCIYFSMPILASYSPLSMFSAFFHLLDFFMPFSHSLAAVSPSVFHYWLS